MKKLSLVVATLVLILLMATAALAAVEVPPLPAAYFGSVKNADGTGVNEGTVEALIDGVVCGSIKISNGNYGDTGPGLKLTVQREKEDPGIYITFRVNGQVIAEATQVLWKAGDVQQINLVLPASSVGTSSGGSSGGGSGGGGSGGGSAASVVSSVSEAMSVFTKTIKTLSGNSATDNVATRQKLVDMANDMLEKSGIVTAGIADDKTNSQILSVSNQSIKDKSAEVSSIMSQLTEVLSKNNCSDLLSKLKKMMVIDVPFEISNNGVIVQLPVEALTGLTKDNFGLRFKNPKVNVEMPSSVLKSVDLTNEVFFQFTMKAVETASLPIAKDAEMKVQKAVALGLAVVDSNSNDTKISTLVGKFNVLVPVEGQVVDQELLGVYRYNEQSSNWDYCGGKINVPNQINYSTSQLGLYAVMSYNKSFKDMLSHWATHDVSVMAARHVVKGKTEDSFLPESSITRAEFAAMMVRLLELTDNAAAAKFTDVGSTDWFAGAVGAAVQAGIIKGVSPDKFAPTDMITREQVAVMISRALTVIGVDSGQVGVAKLDVFKDKQDISAWAEVGASVAVSQGIINGQKIDAFIPKGLTTRAEAVTMLYRLDKKQ